MTPEANAKISLRRICEHVFERQKREHASGFLDDDPPHRQLLDPTQFALLTTPAPHEIAWKMIEYADRILQDDGQAVCNEIFNLNSVESIEQEKILCLKQSAILGLELTDTISMKNKYSNKKIIINDRCGLKDLRDIMDKFLRLGVFSDDVRIKSNEIRPQKKKKYNHSLKLVT